MRKKMIVLGMCVIAMMGFAGCGDSSGSSGSGGEAMSYDDYDLTEYIKVGEYKSLEVEDYTIEVSQEEIDERIQANLEAAKETEELDKKTAIKDGDTVNIDYTGTLDGKEFDGGSAEGYDLTIGSGTFIEGFESGLIGEKVGNQVKLELTFPEDYTSEELQGKDVVFDVTINSATRNRIPEYDLEFVTNNTDYKSLEAYEASVKEELETEKTTEAINNQKTELWSGALENTEVIKYPERELQHYIEFNSDQIDQMAESYGVTREEVLNQNNIADEEEFTAINEDASQLRVKQEMLIEDIAAREKLAYSDEEKEKALAEYEVQGFDADMIETQTGRPADEYIHIELLYEKVLDFLLENAKITEAASDEAADTEGEVDAE